MHTVKTAKRHERRPGQYEANRRCSSCRCFLSRNNPLNICAPCQGGEWHSPEELEAMGKLEALGAAA